MKNRVLGMSVAAAIGAIGIVGAGAAITQVQQNQPATTRQLAPVPETKRRRADRSWCEPSYFHGRTWPPVSVAQSKRNAKKARNRLRAKSQHRKAVR